MQARRPERLIGVNVADAAHDRLVEQHPLDRRRLLAQRRTKRTLVKSIIERVTLRTPLSSRWITAATLGIIGSACISVSQVEAGAEQSNERLIGIGLGLVAGLTYALYSWAAHRLITQGVGRAAAMGSVFGLGGLALMPVLVATGAPLLHSPESFAVGAYMALVPMFLGYLLFGYGLTRVAPSTATTLTLAEPAVAALLAVFIVGERLPALGWVGIAVLSASLVVLTLKRR